MDKSDEVEITPTPPEGKRPRRCVQSKLSWHVPTPEPARGNADEEEEGEREGSGDGEEDRKGKRKQRKKSQPRAPRKCSVISNEARGLKADSKISPKKSVKKVGEKHKKEQQDTAPLKAGNIKCSKALDSKASIKNCRRLKNKQKSEATPNKVSTSCRHDLKEPNSHQGLTNESDVNKNLDGENINTSQPVLDLRLEAKIAAEENVRLSAGKQIHPFFTCAKAAKRVPEVIDLTKAESQWSVPDWDCLDSSPIHVFDTLGDDAVSLDWRNWVLMDRSLHDLNGCHALENNLSVFEGSVEPLKFDTCSCEGMHLDKLSNAEKINCSTSATTLHALPNGQNPKEKILPPSQEVHLSTDNSLSSRCASVGNVENEQQDKLFRERLASYYGRCSYSPQCSLWTNKYQPENALEVCGNKESIRSLNEWLKSWHERGLESCKSFKNGDKSATEDGGDSLYEDESDMDEIDGDATLNNVLLITGPIGSGKSAAIYACAKEQGFEIIEVNASDVRNGSHVKQKYGEAMESHGFNRWSCEDPIGPRRKNILELLSSPADIGEGKQIEYGSPEMISRTCNQDIAPAECSLDVMEDRIVSSQVANKTLILFEDVDTVFDEDRGFVSSILQLAETAKRPIILTSNNKNPVLPHVLHRSVLDFTLPSYDELLPHVHMICASEKALVSSHLLDQLIRICLGDIRRTLMLLQFWCQGIRGTGRNTQFTYSPLLCDIDAAHLVMPRVIPWEFKCELSMKVEEEISKTISTVEENLRFMEAMKQQEPNTMELGDFPNIGNGVAKHRKSRKTRRLKRNYPLLDQSEVLAHVCDLEDFSDALRSPMKCARRTVKHRPGTVLSSQSDGQSGDDNLPLADTVPYISTVPILQMQEIPNDSEVAISVYQSARNDMVQIPFENFETASASHICDTFKLQDISCVPESSVVSVAETKEDVCLSTAVSSNSMSATFADFIKSIHVPPGAEVDISDRAVVESNKCSVKNVGNEEQGGEPLVESVHGNEEQGDFQNEGGEPLASVYHLLDECSRADFSMRLVPGKNSICSPVVESVQETWGKLRSQHEDLKPHLASNQKDACSIVKLVSRVADLISESDIMLGVCSPLVSDVLEPSRTPCMEPDAFSWYEEQLEMGSTYAQHGLCFYTNKCSVIGSNLGCENTLNLAQEMLASSNNTMALGKLLTHRNSLRQDSHIEAPGRGISSGRELKSELHDAVLPIVPARLSMSMKGPAFHDYLSFMSQISKLECSRLSESTNKNHRRRSRASDHYLSFGSLPLSPEHLELLARSSGFKDAPRF